MLPAACGADGGNGGEATSGETRTIEHAFGEVEVPVRPERVVAMNPIAFDPVVSLGFDPAASVGNLVSVHEERFEGVETKLDGSEPNLEAVAAAEPDLLLHAGIDRELFSSGTYEQFSEIAPTVVYDFVSDARWRDYFRFYAEALGRGAEADEISANYDARVEDIRRSLGSPEETSVSVIRVRSDSIDSFRVESSFSNSILDDIGFAGTPDVSGTLSLELIPDIEADAIFVFTFGATEAGEQSEQERLEEITASPLWERNPAVRDGRAFVIGDYWFGFGYTAANAVLDDIEEYLLGEGE